MDVLCRRKFPILLRIKRKIKSFQGEKLARTVRLGFANHTKPHKTTQNHTGAHRSTQNNTGAHRTTQEHTGAHRTTQEHTEQHRTTQDHTEPHRTTQNHTKPNKTIRTAKKIGIQTPIKHYYVKYGCVRGKKFMTRGKGERDTRYVFVISIHSSSPFLWISEHTWCMGQRGRGAGIHVKLT